MRRKKFLLLCAMVASMTCFTTACGSGDTSSSEVEEQTDDKEEKQEDSEKDEDSSENKSSEESSEEQVPEKVEADLSKEIIGTWKTYLDMGDSLSQSFGVEVEFKIGLVMEFMEDGTVKMSFVEEDIDSAMDGILEAALKVGLESYYEKAAQSGYSKEEADELTYEKTGMQTEDYLRQLFEEQKDTLKNTLFERIGSFEHEGAYKVENDKLFTGDTPDSLDDETCLIISGDTMTVFYEDGKDIMDGIANQLVFTRQ